MNIILLFLLGAIVGSFLNVLALRINSGLTLGGRSKCPACGKKLRAIELIPILSFFLLRGRCSRCKARISRLYPVVELWTGFVFITVHPLLLPAFCLYIAITVYDLRHKIIPDSLVYASIAIAAIFNIYLFASSYNTFIDLLAGPLLFAFFALVWLISSGKAMGFGDAKLSLSVGLLLGGAQGFSAIIVAFWLGAIVGLFIILSQRVSPLLSDGKKITMKDKAPINMKSELPFAPFIVLGAWVSYFFNLDLLHVSPF